MSYDRTKFEERVAIARETFAGIIAADTYISSAPAIGVVTENVGDVASTITQALAKLGLCIVVVAADADGLVRKGRTLVMRVRFVAQVSEKVLFNQANAKAANVAYRPANAVTLRILKAVDQQPNGLDPADARHIAGVNEFAVLTDRPFELLKTSADVVYEVSATSMIEL